MGKKWDYDVPNVDVWKEALRVLKPGGHMLVACGTRTQHRMAVNIEDAGFEIRDIISWVYGSGFPKSMNIGKAIDKDLGAKRSVVGQKVCGDVEIAKISGVTMASAHANRNNKAIFGYGIENITVPATEVAKKWDGWGTALKPSMELWTLARKPLSERTVAKNVLKFGTGGINIDLCRVATDDKISETTNQNIRNNSYKQDNSSRERDTVYSPSQLGRFPANLIHDGSEDVLGLFPDSKGQQGNVKGTEQSHTGREGTVCYGAYNRVPFTKRSDSGSAARFFYCAKVSKKERGEGNIHPTVKPIKLMRYLCKLITPPRGIILDPFIGSGSTAVAARQEGFNFIGIELNLEYLEIAEKRIKPYLEQGRLYNY